METLRREEHFERGQTVSVLPRVPQSDFPEHNHDFHELVMVTSGCGLHYIEGKPYHISKGSVFCLRAGQVHCFNRSKDLCLTNVVFIPQMMNTTSLLDLLPDDGGENALPLSVGSSAIRECEQLFAKIHRENLSQDCGSSQMAEALFAQFVVLLWREQRRILSATDGDNRLAALIRHIDQHISDDIDFHELAEIFRIPLRTLTRRIVEVTGLSLGSFLLRMRLCHAMRLLSSTQESVTDVAFASGFNDSNNFSSRFHNEFGVSPSQFRKHRSALMLH